MLVLTRRLGEAITISDNIKLIIVDLDGTQVKIGIDAPRDVEIFREELYEKIKGKQFPIKIKRELKVPLSPNVKTSNPFLEQKK